MFLSVSPAIRLMATLGSLNEKMPSTSDMLPKLHALFTTNLAAARDTNRPCNERVLGQVQFNEMIDELVKEIEKPEVNITAFTSSYMDDKDFGHEMRAHWGGIRFRNEIDMAMVKEDLLAAKFNTSFFSKGVVRLTNVAESLARTGLESKKVEWTDLSSKRRDVALQRVHKIEQAEQALRDSADLNTELENLLGYLTRNPDTRRLDALFNQFLGFKDEMKRLCGTGRHGARKSELLDQLDDSEASKLKFYQDLLKPDSSYLQILLRSVVKAKDEAIAKAKELDLANREVRDDKFIEKDLRYDLRSFIVFKDVFNKINNLTIPWHIVSGPMKMFKASMIDRSAGSFFATLGIVIWVASYTFFQIAKAAVACASATIAYGATSIFWACYVSGRFVFGQGFDRLKDEYTKKNQPQDNSLRDQAAIADEARISSLQEALNGADFYKAKAALTVTALARACLARKGFQAEAQKREAAALRIQAFRKDVRAKAEKAKAEEAKIIREGEEADQFLAKWENAIVAAERAHAFLNSKAEGKSLQQSLGDSRLAAVAKVFKVKEEQEAGRGLFASLQPSRGDGAAARANPELMSRSMRQRNFGRE
jgi:hypothetical protein